MTRLEALLLVLVGVGLIAAGFVVLFGPVVPLFVAGGAATAAGLLIDVEE